MLTIGFKEILIIATLVGGLVWLRMFRTTMDRETTKFFRKLKDPNGAGGFGWKGLLIAFIVGMVCCCTVGLLIFRVWSYYHPQSGV